MKHVVLLKSNANQEGGLEKSASRIASAFRAKGAKVSILTTGGQRDSSDPYITFYPHQTSAWPAFLRIEQFDRFTKEWLSQNPADLIFGMDRNRTQTHIRAGNGVHAAYLESRVFTEGRLKYWTCQLNPMHRKILQMEKEAFENPHLKKLFTNSLMVKRQILTRYATDPSKIEVIHNGVEWREMESDFLSWPAQKQKACEKLHLNCDLHHFLFIGNGYLRKGLLQLLTALSRLKTRNFHLSIVGKDNRMELFHANAVALGLKDHVRFFGAQKEIRPFYQLADTLVIPSFYDPFANVTVEALAMGLHVVSSKHNGGHEILGRENGTLIEDLLDPDAFLFALETALQKRKTEQSAHLARQSVEHLDFSLQLKKLIEACELG